MAAYMVSFNQHTTHKMRLFDHPFSVYYIFAQKD